MFFICFKTSWSGCNSFSTVFRGPMIKFNCSVTVNTKQTLHLHMFYFQCLFLAAMPRIIAFQQNKRKDRLQLGSTLPKLANLCRQQSTDSKFFSFTEKHKHILEKPKEIVGGSSIGLQRNWLLKKPVSENQRTYLNLSMGLTPANWTSTQFVNRCKPLLYALRFLFRHR